MNTLKPNKQPWLSSGLVDGIFILSPPFLALLAVACFPEAFKTTSAMPLIYWVLLVVMIDVAHVYSTLYRTYFRLSAIRQQPMLVVIPFLCYVVGVLLYNIDGMIFWRILAYLAVFHFIRQQYGFMRLYSRKEQQAQLYRRIDTLAIYTATLYPLVYWHVAGGRQFNWFINGDFLIFRSAWISTVGSWLYAFVIVTYLVKETVFFLQSQKINLPRNLIVLGTFLSWYFGIVYYNGDMAFTTLNVISHGIPYMALVWLMEQKRLKQSNANERPLLRAAFRPYTGVLVFVIFLILLAYVEEGLWDGLVWREHTTFFQAFNKLPLINDSLTLALLIPLLALPQSTHYVLDGFIWKRAKQDCDFNT
ncbi:hypothetical protein LLH06_07720 [Mucilaginibacter daejeonensis]|uniref:hypothetical protein n=1 Tax=Mucilaginibacter daejeonensis TaxID=398049 RepID=UPI001D17548C|nr:hypothetical protein [Mucilaginibacter daejeonensis]UEG54850.1 hypothetical protein LLH06_07720 [Mucilaginibacter daejeonensis]